MHRLALAFGCTLRELGDRMTSTEITEWLAYYRLEPFGAERDNWHMAQLAALMANANRRKGSAAIKPRDFMFTDPGSAADEKAAQLHAGFKRKTRRKS